MIIKKVSLIAFSALALSLMGCGKREDKLKLTFRPDQSFIVPGFTYSCAGDRSKSPDLKGPYVKFGYNVKNMTTSEYLRFMFVRVKATSGILMGSQSATISYDASEDTLTMAPGDEMKVASSTMGTNDDRCIDPFSGFSFKDAKIGGSVTFTWKFYFAIKDPNSTVETPYTQIGVTTGRYLGE